MQNYRERTDQFVGFGRRLKAYFVDYVFIGVVLLPAGYLSGFFDAVDLSESPNIHPFVIWGNAFFAAYILGFWAIKSATPGKLVLGICIADAKTGNKPSNLQFIIRFVGYLLSGLPLGLGFLWIAVDPRNQAWHDKLASTVVIQREQRS